MSLIEFRDITKIYMMGENRVSALGGVNFKIEKGELTAIVGESGSGKSTIMNIVGLLDRQTTGEYYLNNKEVENYTDDELAALRNQMIGFIFQQYFLLPKLDAGQNVALPLLYRNTPRAEVQKKVLSTLDKVGMAEKHHHRPSQLSGGQQQRVAIARALVGEPSVILADEPTGALDSKTSQDVMDMFIELNKSGLTIVIVTHDLHVAAQCQKAIHVHDGQIVKVEG